MHKINLMDAYVIETLRSHGISNQKILEAAENNKTESFHSVKDGMDYSLLDRLHEEGKLQSILEDGYQVTFLTSNGLKNLIRMKYGRTAGEDFSFEDFTVEGLQISDDETAELEALLSQNWILKRSESGVSVAPATN